MIHQPRIISTGNAPAENRGQTFRSDAGCPTACPHTHATDQETGASYFIGDAPLGRRTAWATHRLGDAPLGRRTAWATHRLGDAPLGRRTAWATHRLGDAPLGRRTAWATHRLGDAPLGRRTAWATHRLIPLYGPDTDRQEAFPHPSGRGLSPPATGSSRPGAPSSRISIP